MRWVRDMWECSASWWNLGDRVFKADKSRRWWNLERGKAVLACAGTKKVGILVWAWWSLGTRLYLSLKWIRASRDGAASAAAEKGRGCRGDRNLTHPLELINKEHEPFQLWNRERVGPIARDFRITKFSAGLIIENDSAAQKPTNYYWLRSPGKNYRFSGGLS